MAMRDQRENLPARWRQSIVVYDAALNCLAVAYEQNKNNYYIL